MSCAPGSGLPVVDLVVLETETCPDGGEEEAWISGAAEFNLPHSAVHRQSYATNQRLSNCESLPVGQKIPALISLHLRASIPTHLE